MLDSLHKGSGCLKCPMNEFDCDAQYRGSQCAAIRAKAGIDSDPRTNADRIRAMSDEELAEFMGRAHCDRIDSELCRSYCGVCSQCRLDWLKEPAPEEGEQ